MELSIPFPGDLISVEISRWPPLPSGGRLRVCEPSQWFEEGNLLTVAPRDLVSTFWGPESGPPEEGKPLVMHSVGGPYRILQLDSLTGLVRAGSAGDTFWHWRTQAQSGDGVQYQREVTLWRLPELSAVEGVCHEGGAPSQTDREDALLSVHPIIRQIIDRDCHVSQTQPEVIRHVISRLRNGYQTFRMLPSEHRRRLIDDCILQHRGNQELYRRVMGGYLAKMAESNLTTRYPSSLSGQQIVWLMQRCGVTVEKLAFRLGCTMARVREVRERGLGDLLVVRDWIEAITGEDPGPLPVRYRLKNPSQEETCRWCGYPMAVGESGYLYLSEVFCSRHCARKSRGW